MVLHPGLLLYLTPDDIDMGLQTSLSLSGPPAPVPPGPRTPIASSLTAGLGALLGDVRCGALTGPTQPVSETMKWRV